MLYYEEKTKLKFIVVFKKIGHFCHLNTEKFLLSLYDKINAWNSRHLFCHTMTKCIFPIVKNLYAFIWIFAIGQNTLILSL